MTDAGMLGQISSVLASAKALGDIVKSAHELTNYNELVAAVSEVNAKLMAATSVALASQEKQAALAERVRELEQQVAQAKDWEGQMQRYALVEFPTGAISYRLKQDVANGELSHHICAACVDQRAISKLQPVGDKRFLYCHNCKLRIQTVPMSPALRRATSSYIDG